MTSSFDTFVTAKDRETGRPFEIHCRTINRRIDSPGMQNISRRQIETTEGYPVELLDGDAFLIRIGSEAFVAN
jgi:hypothetical protein